MQPHPHLCQAVALQTMTTTIYLGPAWAYILTLALYLQPLVLEFQLVPRLPHVDPIPPSQLCASRQGPAESGCASQNPSFSSACEPWDPQLRQGSLKCIRPPRQNSVHHLHLCTISNSTSHRHLCYDLLTDVRTMAQNTCSQTS